MEILSAEFLYALAAIVAIDLILAGDNAIVIALASRNLPAHLRRRAIIWGSAGAVVVRAIMTAGVVWLLKVPGLLLIGGALLLWIAYKLLVNEEHTDEKRVAASASFFGAMKTIVIADAVMGVDNVLAVAGAAQGSYLLVVLGLLISIPIVIWGSTMLLHLTQRFPIVIYAGAGVLALTGVKMMLSEPLVDARIAEAGALRYAVYLLAVFVVLAAGYLINQRRRIRSALRTHAAVRREIRRGVRANAATRVDSSQGGVAMKRVLVPVDGSENALAAVKKAAEDYRRHPIDEIILLNVRPRFNKHIGRFVSKADRTSFRNEQAERALAPARALLERYNVPFQTHVAVGPRGETIAEFAREHDCRRIVVGTARKNSLTRLLENSVTATLLERANVPVEVVVGNEASRVERFGVPVGIGAALAAVLLID